MQDCFRSMMYDNLLVWNDDLLLFAKTPEGYLSKLRQFFAVLCARKLKLNAKKCVLFPLVSLPLSPTAASLQQFLCAANWLRDSMIDYALAVHPLQKMLDQVMAQHGRQAFVDKDVRVCLLTGASNTGWVIVVSQIQDWDEGNPVAEQTHELLVCRGGQFTGSRLNWSIVEKEAYPVNGIYIYCAHANLVYIFAPDKTVKPYLRGKLQLWAIQIAGPTIGLSGSAVAVKHIGLLDEDIAEDTGVGYFDGVDMSSACMFRHLEDDRFVWPFEEAKTKEQRRHQDVAPAAADEDGHGQRGGDDLLKALSKRFAVTTRRYECSHMDYLELGESYADSAASSTAAEVILDWYKRFGLPEMWESENGSHFKAELMKQLADKLKAVPNFVPVYTPWINGTVERVNRDILQAPRVMLLEFQLDTQLFTGLLVPSMLDTMVVPVAGAARPLTTDMATATPHRNNLHQHLASIHKEVADRKEKRRSGQENARGNLLVRWIGPFKITQALARSFIVAHLLTNEEFEVHGSRQKRYCDSDLGDSAEIREHVASRGIVLGIRAIVDYRFEPSANE
ncbi:hypothetical protein PHMEG_00020817 [Phytophthora megakarya]|uniref:Integrase catalytic domain-containing protein n=1 Tax=Phytophthora megakarya TaxID=4795 RepID=A0A225VQQ8_9STRA|nr:hypothetical protein PHMEG_00020817 [Phytophthora megakarya]